MSRTPGDERRARASSDRLGLAGFAPGVQGWSDALRSGDAAERSEAAFLMGLGGDPRARSALEGALEDGEARVRVEAALALARLGWRDRADAVLADELGGEFFRDAPLRAARALALLGDDSGYGRVRDALASALASNRAEAVAALSVFVPLAGAGGGIDPVGALVAVAGRDPEPVVRGDALTAMAGVGDPRVADALARARRDADPAVRAIAERLAPGAADEVAR